MEFSQTNYCWGWLISRNVQKDSIHDELEKSLPADETPVTSSQRSQSSDLPMTSVSSDTEACLDLPHLDGLVPAAAEDVVPGGEETDAADVVVVAVHGLDTLEGVEVPQLDGHVGATGSQHLTVLV